MALNIDWPVTFLEIERAVLAGDYGVARVWLQKYAYTVVRPEVPQAVRDRFKDLMTAFAREDPLYRDILACAHPLVAAQPGILQTALYTQLSGYDEEQVRYVLHFAHELGDLVRVKKGRSYQLFIPSRMEVCSPTHTITQVGPLTVTASIVVNRNPLDERISELHKQATAYKGDNWDAAIACLREASDLMRQSNGYPTERWTRLPVFLQQAGRFEEAMAEFERLLTEVESRIATEFDHQSEHVRTMHVHGEYARIYDKIRMVCQRQKLKGEAEKYAKLAQENDAKYDEMRAIEDAIREKNLETRKSRRPDPTA